MKAYRLEILVIDHDDVGLDVVTDAIEGARYPNRCIAPIIKRTKTADVGTWSDDHPLNKHETHDAEYRRLFGKPSP